jgi:putative ABC transport system ATP-binding protein
MIGFEQVTKVFGTGPAAVRALNDLSFACERGSFTAIMGPSGSGKSTVLHLAAGLTTPTSGRVVIGGTDIAAMGDEELADLRLHRIGYVMQSANLLPYLTVDQNVAVPLALAGIATREHPERAHQALELAQIGHRARHRPTTLSGGEQQRVALARAIVMSPPILLADEPTGNLDQQGGRAVMDLIQDLNEDLGVTVVMVTHDPVFAACAHRILRVVDGSLTDERVYRPLNPREDFQLH